MLHRYVIVRKNSTTGAFIVERNHLAPGIHQAPRAEIAGYADTLREAEALAAEANEAEAEAEERR